MALEWNRAACAVQHDVVGEAERDRVLAEQRQLPGVGDRAIRSGVFRDRPRRPLPIRPSATAGMLP